MRILPPPSSTPCATLRSTYDASRAEHRAAHGGEGGICLTKIIHVAESRQKARDNLREPTRWFFHTQAGLIADPAGVPPEQYKFYKRVRENLLSLSEEQALDQAAIVGEPEEVADKIRQHADALGITYFMGAFSRGGLPQEAVRQSLRLFGEKVMPRLG